MLNVNDILRKRFSFTDNEFYGNPYPGRFPGVMPGQEFYAGPPPPPGGQPIMHPITGMPHQGHSATFMPSPPAGALSTGNNMAAILPTSGAAGLCTPPQLQPQMAMPPQGHQISVKGHRNPPLPLNPIMQPSEDIMCQLTVLPSMSHSINDPSDPMTPADVIPPNQGEYQL